MSYRWEIIAEEMFIYEDGLLTQVPIGALYEILPMTKQPGICIASGTYTDIWSNCTSLNNTKTHHWARYLLVNPEICEMSDEDKLNWLRATYNSFKSSSQNKLIGIRVDDETK